MICVCGHGDDLHEFLDNSNDGGMIYGGCEACKCNSFCKDIDRDELETE